MYIYVYIYIYTHMYIHLVHTNAMRVKAPQIPKMINYGAGKHQIGIYAAWERKNGVAA